MWLMQLTVCGYKIRYRSRASVNTHIKYLDENKSNLSNVDYAMVVSA